MMALNSGIRKDLRGNLGSVQLSATDLLRTMRINTYYGTLTQEAFNIKNHVNINTESARFPIIKLTYTRSFGSGSLKNSGAKNNDTAEEQERIRKG